MKDQLAFQKDMQGLINKHYPSATRGNIEQNSQCASDLAMTMGAMLAFAFRLNGEVIGRTVLASMVQRIIECATAIDATAGDVIRNSLPKITAPGTPTKQ